MDEAANARGLTRSGFLASAAREKMWSRRAAAHRPRMRIGRRIGKRELPARGSKLHAGYNTSRLRHYPVLNASAAGVIGGDRAFGPTMIQLALLLAAIGFDYLGGAAPSILVPTGQRGIFLEQPLPNGPWA